MEKRYYIVLAFEIAKNDRLEKFGTDLSKASEVFDDLRQVGGPDGVVHATLVSSTGRVLKSSAVYSKAWHAKQAKVALEAPAQERAHELTSRAQELIKRQAEIVAELDSIRSTGLVPELAVTAPDVPAPAGSTEDNDPGKVTGDQTSLLTPGLPEV